jgi:hypothetical protein
MSAALAVAVAVVAALAGAATGYRVAAGRVMARSQIATRVLAKQRDQFRDEVVHLRADLARATDAADRSGTTGGAR